VCASVRESVRAVDVDDPQMCVFSHAGLTLLLPWPWPWPDDCDAQE